MVIEARGSETVLDTRALEKVLRERVDGEVRFDAGSRGAYATYGSNYRQVPIGVVVPRTIDAGADAVAVCAGRHRQARPASGRGTRPRHGRTTPARRPPREARRPEGSARDGRLLVAGAAASALGAAAAGTYWFRNRQSAR